MFGKKLTKLIIDCNLHMLYLKSIQSQLKLVKDENRNKAANEKNILTDLCHERRRLSWNNLDYGSTYYVLSRKFLTAWQSFIR